MSKFESLRQERLKFLGQRSRQRDPGKEVKNEKAPQTTIMAFRSTPKLFTAPRPVPFQKAKHGKQGREADFSVSGEGIVGSTFS
jgi:hypothetical protein